MIGLRRIVVDDVVDVVFVTRVNLPSLLPRQLEQSEIKFLLVELLSFLLNYEE